MGRKTIVGRMNWKFNWICTLRKDNKMLMYHKKHLVGNIKPKEGRRRKVQ